MHFFLHLMPDFDLRSPKISQEGHKIDQLYGNLLCLSYLFLLLSLFFPESSTP